MRSLLFGVCLVLLAVVASAQTSQPQPSARFSIDNIDKSVDPCADFYQYACGNWLKTKEIPGDRPSWDSFSEVEEQNLAVLRDILETAEKGGAGRDVVEQKIGDYYGACMDENAVEGKGISPIKPELDRIAAAKSKQDLIDAVAQIHLIGPTPLFNFYSSPDLHNANMVIAYIDQGGLSLPDRNYYLKDEAKMVALRKALTSLGSR